MRQRAIPAFIPGKGGKKHVFYDLQMEVEAAKDDQVSDFFPPDYIATTQAVHMKLKLLCFFKML